jgi:hypothetical protein
MGVCFWLFAFLLDGAAHYQFLNLTPHQAYRDFVQALTRVGGPTDRRLLIGTVAAIP